MLGGIDKSPMPFGCVPIRQWCRFHSGTDTTFPVSNAFRLCAYPAGARTIAFVVSAEVSNAFRLCAYPAAETSPRCFWLTVIVSNAFRLCAYPAGTFRRLIART